MRPLLIAAAAALLLSACDSAPDTAAEAEADRIENAGEARADALEDQADTLEAQADALKEQAEALNRQADEVEHRTDAQADAIEQAAGRQDDGPAPSVQQPTAATAAVAR